MENWLMIRGIKPSLLFFPIKKVGHAVNSSNEMSSNAIYKIFPNRSIETSGEFFSPHYMQRTYISDLLDTGVDIVMLSKHAGHASGKA